MNPVLTNSALTDPPPAATFSSTGDVICALKKVAQLSGLTDEEYEWLAGQRHQRHEPAAAVLFHEGEAATRMTILLKGEIHVRRQRGAHGALFIGRSGQITGVLPFSRMKIVRRTGVYHYGDLGAGVSTGRFPGDAGGHTKHGANLRGNPAGPGSRRSPASNSRRRS